MQNNISIIGSSGYIGKNLNNYLSKKKYYNIFCVNSKNGNLLSNQILKISKNFNNSKVIYLAAKHRKHGDTLNLKRQNIKMLKNFLSSIKKNIPRLIIFVSTVEVYGKCKKKINEKTFTKPLNKYAEGKIIQEKLISNYCKKKRVNYLILRIPGIYGKKYKDSIIHKIYKTYLRKNPIWHSSAEEKRDYLHVEDFVKIIEKILNKKKSSINLLNITSGKSIKLKNIFSLFMNNKKKIKVIKYIKHHEEFDLIFDNKKLKKFINKYKFKTIENEIKKY
ncbi:NAD-dependent epimerase/dehydratase family protein [Candidatus Pelagibacter bacterium nBUS_30]|uniref:NAD-dependent epimerase/dehydratase family protein n=1 Tax=Candidatus Pelagibacter bacterium nBUS_30 TaxID=3374191 RepID=UPI003EBC1DF0